MTTEVTNKMKIAIDYNGTKLRLELTGEKAKAVIDKITQIINDDGSADESRETITSF